MDAGHSGLKAVEIRHVSSMSLPACIASSFARSKNLGQVATRDQLLPDYAYRAPDTLGGIIAPQIYYFPRREGVFSSPKKSITVCRLP